MYKDEFVSFGAGYEFVINGQTLEFYNNNIKRFKKADTRNLFMCKYLNLNGASVT